MPVTHRPAGQKEKLTSRISNLIRSYPKGVGIIKEFVQNADDAGARTVSVVMDWRSHPIASVPPGAKDTFRELLGPALLISNDRPFTPEDIENIQEIGDSDKALDASTTGRFGLGFNSCYNVTEAPSFVTRDEVIYFDPQKVYTNTAEPGVRWPLGELWDEHSDLLAPYVEGRLEAGTAFHERTTFRLPLRTAGQAARSKLSKEPFSSQDFEEVLGKATASASELILFLKRVLDLEIWEITESGERVLRLRVTTVNKDHVEAQRGTLGELVERGYDTVAERLRGTADPLSVSYTHDVLVEAGADRWEEKWHVVSGLYGGTGGDLVTAMEQMAEVGEKTVPWAGAAALVEATGGPHETGGAVRGRAFCFLPLPQETGFPVHLNGFFDPDDARQGVTNDHETTESAAHRTRWNELLVEHAVAPAYAGLLASLTEIWPPDQPAGYYALWPQQTSSSPPPFDRLRSRVYELLVDAPVVLCTGGGAPRWRPLGNVLLIPHTAPGLRAPMLADGADVPDASFPASVRDGLAKAGAQKNEITPRVLRERLRAYEAPDAPLEEVPQRCLRDQSWLEEMLRHCLSDGPGDDLKGVPLALTTDGKLRAFGPTRFIATDEERALFPRHPHWFVQTEYADRTGLGEAPDPKAFGVLRMSAELVALNIKAYVGEGPACDWDPEGPRAPNAGWLASVLRYLSQACATGKGPKRETVQKRPLIPTPDGTLCAMALPGTPVLIPHVVEAPLLAALRRLGIPTVGGPAEVVDQVRAMSSSWDGAVPALDACTLVSGMERTKTEWEPDLDIETANPVLDFLAETEHVREIAANPSCAGALAGFRIFPTVEARFARIEPDRIFLPESTPPATGDAELYVAGVEDRWRPLLQQLGARPLDLATVIRDVLLPAFADLNEGDRTATLAWIRDNVESAKTRLRDRGTPGDVAVLEKALKDAHLVTDQAGVLRRAREVYDPKRKSLIRRVVGARALFPAVAVYGREWPRLHPLFRDLGLRGWPHPVDIVARIDELVEEAEVSGASTVSDDLLAIYHYVSEHWESLSKRKAGSVPFPSALAQRAWLPALRDTDRLAGFAAFAVPEDRLYSPAQLYPRRLGHLVAARCPLQAFPKEPSSAMADALGFPRTASEADVIANFDAVVSAWEGGLGAEVLARSLPEIYRYFGEVKEPSALAELRAHYENRPCIWSSGSRAFFEASRVFTSRASGLAPFAVMVRVEDPGVHAGFEALGMRDVPEIADYEAYLESLGDEGDTISEDSVSRAVKVLRWASQVASQEGTKLPDLLVVTESGVLIRASRAFVPDAPWYEGKLDTDAVPLLHRDVPREVAELTGMASLSESVYPELTELLASDNPDFTDSVRDLHDAVRSNEFARGLHRLVVAEHGFDRGADKKWVSELSVRAVESLHTTLWLGQPNEGIQIGSGEDEYYFDPSDSPPVVYLSESAGTLAPTFLAEAVNQNLDTPLSNVGYVEKMMTAPPDEVMFLLDRLRVPPLAEQAEEGFDEGPAEEVVFERSPNVSVRDGQEVSLGQPQTPAETPPPDDEGEQVPPPAPLHSEPTTSAGPHTVTTRLPEGDHSPRSGGDHRGTSSALPPAVNEKEDWRREAKGDGSSRASRRPSSTRPSGRRRSYVTPAGSQNGNDEFTFDGRERRLEVGDAAVERVIDYERGRGLKPQEMGHWNEGYDVESYSPEGTLERHIEVKGLAGAWGDGGVPLSRKQFKFGRQHPDTFWLYVVEWAENPDRSTIYTFKDPVRYVQEFRFDAGWKAVADGVSGPEQNSQVVSPEPTDAGGSDD